VNNKKIEITIGNYDIGIYRRDSNGVFKIAIFSNNKSSIDFERIIFLSSDNIKKEYIWDTLEKPLYNYTYENVKNNLVSALKTKEEKVKYIDKLFERYLEWYEAKKLIEG